MGAFVCSYYYGGLLVCSFGWWGELREVSAETTLDGKVFHQEIAIRNLSESTGVDGVRIPDMVISYQLVPGSYTGTVDQRYVKDEFPARSSNVISTGATTMIYNHLIPSQAFANGKLTSEVEISEDTFFKDGGTALSMGKPLKIYRYQLRMTGIYTDPAVIAEAGGLLGMQMGDLAQSFLPPQRHPIC